MRVFDWLVKQLSRQQTPPQLSPLTFTHWNDALKASRRMRNREFRDDLQKRGENARAVKPKKTIINRAVP